MRNDAPLQRNQWAVSNQALSLVRALAGRVGTQQRYRSASDETMIAEDILGGEHPSLAGDTWRHCHHGILPVTPAAGFRARHFLAGWNWGVLELGRDGASHWHPHTRSRSHGETAAFAKTRHTAKRRSWIANKRKPAFQQHSQLRARPMASKPKLQKGDRYGRID